MAMFRVGKSLVNSYTTRNVVFGVLTIMILVFATLFFLKSLNGIHFTKVAKRSETGLLGSIRNGHRECAGTEKGIDKQNEVTDRLNTNMEDFSLEAISKASMTKQQIEKHLHKDWFLSPSQLPCNF